MKKYILEVIISDEGEVAQHEKAEKLSFPEVRQVIAILEERKMSLVNQVINLQRDLDARTFSHKVVKE